MWENNIKIDFKETECEDGDCTQLTESVVVIVLCSIFLILSAFQCLPLHGSLKSHQNSPPTLNKFHTVVSWIKNLNVNVWIRQFSKTELLRHNVWRLLPGKMPALWVVRDS
jgi:hypothetical protein